MEQEELGVIYNFGDRTTSDISIRLRNKDVRTEWFYCHSAILTRKSKYFADWLSNSNHACPDLESNSCIEVHCEGSEYDHYVKLFKLLYLCDESLLDSWDSVKSAIGVLQAAIALQCGAITQSCIQYLEAVPWEENEEEIIRVVPTLGPEVMPLLARIQPVDTNSTKNVFVSAINFSTTIVNSFPPFGDDLKTSAQEQVEYMLLEDKDTPLVVDEDVKSSVRKGLDKVLSTLGMALGTLPSSFEQSVEVAEQTLLQSLSDLEWMCNVLPKMDMMKDFVSGWVGMSDHMLAVIQEEKYSSSLWSVKLAGKALDSVGYGSVLLPASSRVYFLKSWLPYLRKMKPLLDSKAVEDETFPYKMNSDLCENTEGAITSLVLALPSSDQADVLADWMKMTEQLTYPDLSEAFEVWCYRTKTAKRRLTVGLNGLGNPAVTL